MTVTYGFYDSLNNDRRYNAMQFSSLMDSIIRDGIFLSIGTAFAVSAGTGLQVVVGIGRAWFMHTWTYNDSNLYLTITTPHAVLDRIDTVVIETNSDQAVRANSIKVIAGTPASSPVAPTLQHTSTLNQYPLANVLVVHASTQIVQQNITNRVGTSDCPFVTGILETLDIDSLVAQWQDDFETWFTYLQNELDANQAANLLAQIMEHDHSNPVHTQVVTGGIADGAISLLKLAAGLKFQKIAEFAGNGTNQPDFSAIPTTFTNLILIWNGLGTDLYNYDFKMRVNSDAAAHYTDTVLYFDDMGHKWNYGINNPNTYGLNCGAIPGSQVGSLFSASGFVIFPNYKSTTLYKTSICFSAGSANTPFFELCTTKWASTAAINRLTGYMQNGFPKVGSLFSLYGFN